MRLLQLDSDGRLSLTEHSDNIPPYAILSHTWGADNQEVTFQDIQEDANRLKAGYKEEGYRKLTFCGEKAASDALKHFWVDTCCIDKPNYTELSESINSMFRWYQNAAKCYVYLPDVLLLGSDGEETLRVTWELAFRKSRWFTRGWTLQELIAPTSVTFFSKEGQKLGDKASLETLLHEITGIPIDTLRGKPLSDFSINDRFSWLGNRQTKRAEDRAYSLFGIFDVHLPLIYGEGEEKAFRRLRQEISRDPLSETNKQCIADLRVTDPRDDKTRIQDTKGGLIKDLYVWVLENSDFHKWRNNKDETLLWVKGDPGKGKTMLLCGIIDELAKSPTDGSVLAYFFCQATDKHLNTATAVVRSLIFMLVDKDNSLISHMEKNYNTAGKVLFEGTNAWEALRKILTDILQDSKLQGTHLVVDALDECVEGRSQLLDLIVQTSQSTGTKWLISSRNWPEIEEQLSTVAQRLSLERNQDSVAVAVKSYIKHKVKELAKEKAYSLKTKRHIHRYLSNHASGTFLWAALVCKELKTVPEFDARKRVETFPSGLDTLYQRMMEQIGASNVSNRCHQLLALAVTVYRPLSALEYVSFFGDLNDLPSDTESEDTEWGDNDSERIIPEEPKFDMTKAIRELVSFCGSFLTVREDTIYFVHQSAKDFLMAKQSNVLFPQTQASVHDQIFSKSLEAMNQTLKRDMYGLQHPGFSIEDVFRQVPDPDPLAAIRYACAHWVNHLVDASKIPGRSDSVQDGGVIEAFLQRKSLYWIEALSLQRNVSEGMLSLEKLKHHLQRLGASRLHALVLDTYRLLQSFRPAIESRPLQVYASALVFSPTQSLLRGLFRFDEPGWVGCRTKMASYWSTCEATLEGHTECVNSAVFSADGRFIVSASDDRTVKLWNASTGACEVTLTGHAAAVNSAVFSADRQRIVSASNDMTIKIWNAATGACEATLTGHTEVVNSAAFSADGRHIISASNDKVVKLWNTTTGTCESNLKSLRSHIKSAAFSADGRRVVAVFENTVIQIWETGTGARKATLLGRQSSVNSAAFSADGEHVVSASDNAVKLWNAATGVCEATLTGHTHVVNSAAFSVDGRHVVSASGDKTVKLWNAATGACEATLTGHTDAVNSVAFSADKQRIVSASKDKTVKLWDATTSARRTKLEDYESSVYLVAFSADGRRAISASHNNLELWDVATGRCEATFQGHKRKIGLVAFSTDGRRIISASHDTIKLWDAVTGACELTLWNAVTGACEATLTGHTHVVNSATFSVDGRHVVSASGDKTVKLWNAATGACEATLTGHTDTVYSVAFSSDGRRLVSASVDKTVKLWNTTTGICESTFTGHTSSVRSAGFSADGQRVVSASDDKTVKLWNTTTGICESTFTGHTNAVRSAAFSADGRSVVSGSHDKTAKLWNAATGACEATFTGHTDAINSVAFSSDGRRLVSASVDKTVKLWNTATGMCEATFTGHISSVRSASFSADGQRIVSASLDRTVKLWNAATGACEATVTGHTDVVNSAGFSTDGRRVVSASFDKTVKLWNTDTGISKATVKSHTGRVNSAVFSTDGRHVVSASADKTVKLWNVATGACEATLTGHTHVVNSAAFSVDGRHIVSASGDKTVKLWNAATGAFEATFEGHTDWVNLATFSADGRHIVSASDDMTVKLWEVTTGACKVTLEGHSSKIKLAASSADGRHIVSASGNRAGKPRRGFIMRGGRVFSASDDQTVRLWNAATGTCLCTYNIGFTSTLSFDLTGTLIHTDAGDIHVDKLMPVNADTHLQKPARWKEYGLSPDRAWILKQSKEILWLPPEYRPRESAMFTTERGTNLVLGCQSGRVYIFHLS